MPKAPKPRVWIVEVHHGQGGLRTRSHVAEVLMGLTKGSLGVLAQTVGRIQQVDP